MSSTGTAVLATVMTGLVTAAAVGPVLRALPEPRALHTRSATALLTPGFIALCGGLAAAAAAITWYRVPLAAMPLWTVLSTAGVLLAAIDARTTWLPLRSRGLPGC